MNQKDKSLISKVKGRCFYCSNDVLKNRKCISLWKLLIGQKLLYRIAIVIIFAKIDRFSVIGHCETRIYSHTELKLYFLFSKEVVQSVNKTTTPRQIFVIYIYDAAIESTIFNKNNLYFYFPVKSFFFKQLSRPFRGYHKEFFIFISFVLVIPDVNKPLFTFHSLGFLSGNWNETWRIFVGIILWSVRMWIMIWPTKFVKVHE